MGNEEFKLPPTPPEGKLTLGTTGKHPIQGPPTLPQCQPSLSETAPPLLVTVSIPIPPGKASQRPIQQPEHQISLLPGTTNTLLVPRQPIPKHLSSHHHFSTHTSGGSPTVISKTKFFDVFSLQSDSHNNREEMERKKKVNLCQSIISE